MRERDRLRHAEYRASHKEEEREAKKRWANANMDKRRRSDAKRLAAKRLACEVLKRNGMLPDRLLTEKEKQHFAYHYLKRFPGVLNPSKE
jgi:hypothetical protein